MGRDGALDRTEAEKASTMNQDCMNARAQGFREALWEIRDIISDITAADVRREALAEIDALLADAMSE